MIYVITYLRKCTIVPEVAMMGKAVADVAKLAFFYVLFDRVQRFFFANLSHSLLISKPRRSVCLGSLSQQPTSIFALVHLGISTIMFSTVCCSLA